MSLKRISKQGKESLSDYYQNLIQYGNSYQKQVGNMLYVIQVISDLFVTRDIWALTSVNRLVLLLEDNWQGDWIITISSDGFLIFIEYLESESLKNIVIETNKEQFAKELLFAINECNVTYG